MRKVSSDFVKAVNQIEKKIPTQERKQLPKDFCSHLLSGIDHEDLHRFTPESLAQLAICAFKDIQKRKMGHSGQQTRSIELTQTNNKVRSTTVITLLNDNMAFMVNSIVAEFISRSIDIQLLIHPIFTTKRNRDGLLTDYYGTEPPSIGAWLRESLIMIVVDEIEDKDVLQSLLDNLNETIKHLSVANRDWKGMVERVNQAITSYESNPPHLADQESSEATAFLRWLKNDHFVFLGMREYRFDENNPEAEFIGVNETALGILSDPDLRVLRKGRELVVMTPEMREFLRQPTALIVTKASLRSRIHRRAHLDYIGVKLFDSQSKLVGELRIVGLFTSDAYNLTVRSIPYVRIKIDNVLSESGFDPAGHSGKALMNVLENYPRDELFQIDSGTLMQHAMVAMHIKTRPQVRVMTRIDKFDRYASIMVYIPKDHYNTSQKILIGDYLSKAFDGHVSAVYPDYPEPNFARVHYIIGRYEGKTPNPGSDILERDIAAICRDWLDAFKAELHDNLSSAEAHLTFRSFSEGFSAAYQDHYSPSKAVDDTFMIKRLNEGEEIGVELYNSDQDHNDGLEIRVFHPHQPYALTKRVPMLETIGFSVVSEQTYKIKPHSSSGEASPVYLHDMKLALTQGEMPKLHTIKDRVEDCYKALSMGLAETDGYNGLLLTTSLDWQSISVLRAIGRYLRQAGLPYSQSYLWMTLRNNSQITAKLFELFDLRNNPKSKQDLAKRVKGSQDLTSKIENQLNDVANLDQDRILRAFLQVILACKRTNFYQTEAEGRLALGFKIQSCDIEFLPQPKPLFEIYVYSTRVEGVHLRFGKVARGGLRWSDRMEDFRTEILGLVKAQQSKNAVIVPVGSKGGFVPQNLPPASDRQAMLDEGIACYKIFIDTLLSLTDNLNADNEIIPPQSVVRHDENDPYLVVAADKGTATFSDIANGISEGRDFWLGDAFASGGSVGYDHKVMGITARGGWEAVKRHFREMDHDIQTQPFTVVGVGDMSGDVFGNGMLLSPKIKLIGAFDHRDIFVDPNPDMKRSLQERQRLFDMGRSSWQDYNTECLSKGGGIFSRAAKSITLSEEMREVLDLDQDKATPNEVIRAILKAKVDLLWFGGIGTYVCAHDESNDQVGDRATDAIRIAGNDVRARVIGEGANLGATQRGRIEYSLNGGCINTDAIDNVAGVNSSDLEVNIKIALGAAMRSQKLSLDERNVLLPAMTDDVASLVLNNNYLQTMSLTISSARGEAGYHFQRHLMTFLEKEAGLNRDVEFLPNDAQLASRIERGGYLTRPEIAVLLAYAKNDLFARLLTTSVPDDPYFVDMLIGYFPSALAETYREEILNHRLKREIIATLLANTMLNFGGATYENRLQNAFHVPLEEIVKAFVIAFDAMGMKRNFEAIHNLDNKISGHLQTQLYRDMSDQLYRLTGNVLRNGVKASGLKDEVNSYQRHCETMATLWPSVLTDKGQKRLSDQYQTYCAKGLDEALADTLSHINLIANIPSLISMAEKTGASLESVTSTYFHLADYFDLPDIYTQAIEADVKDYYDKIALDRALDSIEQIHQTMTISSVNLDKEKGGSLDNWLAAHGSSADRVRASLKDLFEGGRTNLSRIVLAQSLFKDVG